MTRSELIKLLWQDHPDISQQDIHRIVRTAFAAMGDALTRDQRIEFRGFGAFSIRRRKERTILNPYTQSLITVAPRKGVAFRAGKDLHRRLNDPDKDG